MADERERLTSERQPIPAGYRWENLASPTMEGAELDQHYRDTLRVLGTQGGMLGMIFEKAQNKIQDPALLRRLIVELIGREDWSAMAADVKGDAYEGAAGEERSGRQGAVRGQYFTPRAVIQAIVECVQPQPGEIVVDPACGTGGFLLACARIPQARQRLGSRPEAASSFRGAARRGTRSQRRAALRHEPVSARPSVPMAADRREPPITTDDAFAGIRPARRRTSSSQTRPSARSHRFTVVNAEGERPAGNR